MIFVYRITGLFPEVQIFLNGEPLALAENFPNLEIPEPGTLIRSRDRHSMKFYRSQINCSSCHYPCDSLFSHNVL